MLSSDKSICLIFNGEIFNSRNSERNWSGAGHSFATQSDTEVVLESWLEWRPRLCHASYGQFAFALWDRRHETLLARDRAGAKSPSITPRWRTRR